MTNCSVDIKAAYFNKKLWLAECIFEALMIAVSVYVLITTAFYQYSRVFCPVDEDQKLVETISAPAKSSSNFVSGNNSENVQNYIKTTTFRVGRTKIDKIRLFTEMLILLSASINLVSTVLTQLQIYFGTESDSLCTIGFVFNLILFNLSMDALYTVLWMRQRRFYASGPMQEMYSVNLRWFSKVIIVFVIVSTASSTVVFTQTATYKSAVYGCVICDEYFPQWSGLLIVLLNRIAMQVLLLILVLYPLQKALRTRDRLPNNDDRLRSLIIRLATTTSLCVFFDVVFLVATVVLIELTGSEMISMIMYTTCMVICHICVLASFRDWKKRLFACSKM